MAQVASLNPPVIFHLKFPATIAVLRDRGNHHHGARPGSAADGPGEPVALRLIEIARVGVPVMTGPQDPAAAGGDRLRAGHADRDQVIAVGSKSSITRMASVSASLA
jgi:hypothetical protein